MRKKIILFYIVGVALIVSLLNCKKKQDTIRFKEFPKTITLKGKTIDSKPFKSLNIVGTIDSILIVSIIFDDYGFYLFNKEDFSFITKAGMMGKGPKELNTPIIGNIDEINNNFYVGDGSKLKIFRFDIKDMLNSKDYLPEIYTENLPEYFAYAKKINVMKDTIIGMGTTHHNIRILSKEGNLIKSINKVPNKPDNIKAVNHRNLYRNSITYNHKQKQFALAYANFDTLKSYKTSGKKVFQIAGLDFIQTNYEDQYRQETKTAYWELYNDNNYIYGLYSGQRQLKMPSGATTLKDIEKFYPDKIHVFDWEGNPRLRIELDKPVRDIHIDKETNRIIGISFEDKSFVVFDFEKIRHALKNNQ